MYYPHFGLQQPPFKITPNTDFFFSGGNRGAVLDALVYAIGNGEGIVKVVGEVGSGKTMLCRMLQTILPERIESIYLANPSVAPEDVLHAIAFELQLELPKNADRLKVMQALQAHLLSRHAEGRQVVIFVEEAQGMPLATLEEIRLLSNLETKQDKLLQIVLFGQPELDENLNQEQIRQLRERITHRFNLSPLQTKDVGEYLIFRLRAAGYHGPHLFSDASIKKLSHAAQGLVRRVNILADKALLAAFADNVYQVTPKHVKAAIQDSEFAESLYGQQFGRYKRLAMWFICLLVVLSGALAAAFIWQQSPAPQSAAKVGVQPAPIAANKLADAKTADVKPAAVNSVSPQAVKQSAVAVTNTQVGVNTLSALTSANAPAALRNATVASDKPPVVENKSAEGLVSQRLGAMSQLLQNAKPETVLLQIKSVPNAASSVGQVEDTQLMTELESLSRQVEVDNIYLYRMRKADGLYTVVLYGAYAERAAALAALKDLPPNIKNYRPYLRTLAGISKELVPVN
ncbi:AAA family ATPase [Methylotenera mobilis]|uniref:Sporulation domain protein n=1 Tax=Methylotenera mobilis (strain JLW8 / ATCC BAA-1282 / DSM 17540) TaxID=583345 RepID=C6WSQ9_METML|nr:AAA family ATPase [Methylotenera mobilis]ACT47151.1 Sporulation domain protein [Methylotenera mobilis JLW8]